MKRSTTFFIALLALSAHSPAFAQETSVAFGAARQNPDAPIEVTSEQLAVDQEKGTAIFTGDVVVVQEDMTMTAPKVTVTYTQDNSEIEKLEATGGVTLVSGPDTAEADEADYILGEGTVYMRDNVLLLQGASTIASDRMRVLLDAGTAQMSGRVRALLQQQGSD